jgi:hypothetical protein
MNIHVLAGIRTHNLCRRATENLRLRTRGHWDLLNFKYHVKKNIREVSLLELNLQLESNI